MSRATGFARKTRRHLSSLTTRALGRVSRLQVLLPWMSLAWGLTTAFLITRNLSEPGRFVAAGLFFVLAGWLVRFVVDSRFGKGHKIVGLVSAFALQSAAQYVLLFVIPLLFLAKIWVPLAVSCALATVVLWDPWWLRFHRHPAFLIVLRQWIGALVAAAFLVVLVPRALPWLYALISLLCVVFIDRRQLFKTEPSEGPGTTRMDTGRLGSFFWLCVRRGVTVAVLPILAGWQHVSGAGWPFAPVSVWVHNPGFTLGRPVFVDRDHVSGRLARLPAAGLNATSHTDAMLQAQELCCVTPLVAGQGFEAHVTHDWLLDGRFLERIDLRRVRGNGDDAPYRTFSCKKHFPGLVADSVLRCETRAAGRVLLGAVEIHIDAAPR